MASSLGTSDAPGTVSGQVVNAATGTPIPRVLVQLNERSQLTDHEGRFSFGNFDTVATDQPSTISMRVNKPGFYASPEGESTFTTTFAIGKAPPSIRLYPEALLTGTVTARDGSPLPNVPVSAQRSVYNESGHQWIPTAQHTTNSKGEFRLALPPGDYKVETGYLPSVAGSSQSVIPQIYPTSTSSDGSDLIRLASGSEEHLELHPEISASYTVPLRLEQTSDHGFPMMAARSSTGAVIPLNFTRIPSEGGGHIQLPLGTYTLTGTQYTGDSTDYGETLVTVTGAGTPTVVLRMTATPAISVEVSVDPSSTSDKTPPTAQQLGLLLIPSTQVGFHRTFSFGVVATRDRTALIRPIPGTYRFSSIANGQWYIRSATYGGTDILQQEFTVAQSSGNTPIRLVVSDQTGSLTGTVRVAGVPAGAWIYLIPTSPSSTPVYSIPSSPNGIFNFPYLPPGSYRAIAFEQRHQDDYRSPQRLAKYATRLQSVSISNGNKATLDLDAVPVTELLP